MTGSRPVMEKSGRLRRRDRQSGKAALIRGAGRPTRQGLDMTHRQRRTIEKEEGAAGLPVIAPHLDGAVPAHKGGPAKAGENGCGGLVDILRRLAARRGG